MLDEVIKSSMAKDYATLLIDGKFMYDGKNKLFLRRIGKDVFVAKKNREGRIVNVYTMEELNSILLQKRFNSVNSRGIQARADFDPFFGGVVVDTYDYRLRKELTLGTGREFVVNSNLTLNAREITEIKDKFLIDSFESYLTLASTVSKRLKNSQEIRPFRYLTDFVPWLVSSSIFEPLSKYPEYIEFLQQTNLYQKSLKVNCDETHIVRYLTMSDICDMLGLPLMQVDWFLVYNILLGKLSRLFYSVNKTMFKKIDNLYQGPNYLTVEEYSQLDDLNKAFYSQRNGLEVFCDMYYKRYNFRNPTEMYDILERSNIS